MIQTGRTVNFRLGDGDSDRFELLGSEDTVGGEGFMSAGTGFGARFIPTAKDVILRAAQQAGAAGGAAPGGVVGGSGGYGRRVYQLRPNIIRGT